MRQVIEDLLVLMKERELVEDADTDAVMRTVMDAVINDSCSYVRV